MTTVAVVVPTFNRAHTVARALESALRQTRPPDEVIVIDDGSTDATAEIVRRYPRVRLVRLDRNRGAAGARNEGVRLASAELIAFLDSDDAWLANKLELQVRRFSAQPDLTLLCTGVAVHGRDGKLQHHPGPLTPQQWSVAELHTYPFSTSTWMIRRSDYLNAGGFDETLPNCEDLDLLARLASGQHSIEVMPDVLVTKFNQADGIDTDLSRRATSLAILFARHAAMWRQAPAAAAHAHRRLASMHVRAGDLRAARVSLMQALRYRPWQVRLWLLLALSLLGRGVNVALRRVID